MRLPWLDTPSIDPCALLPDAELEAILGSKVGLPVHGMQIPMGKRQCSRETLSGDPYAFLQVSLARPSDMPQSGPSPSDMFAKTRETMDARTDLADLGDAAFIATGGLYILAGRDLIQIVGGNAEEPDIRQRLLRAGEIVLANFARHGVESASSHTPMPR